MVGVFVFLKQTGGRQLVLYRHKFIRFLFQGVVTYSSTYVLVALSVDRCDAITHPMNFTGSCKCPCYQFFTRLYRRVYRNFNKLFWQNILIVTVVCVRHTHTNPHCDDIHENNKVCAWHTPHRYCYRAQQKLFSYLYLKVIRIKDHKSVQSQLKVFWQKTNTHWVILTLL